MRRAALSPAILSMTLLVACGGSSDPDDINGGPDDGDFNPTPGYTQINDIGGELAAKYADQETYPETPYASLPTGTADYAGYAAFYVDDPEADGDPAAVSLLSLTANFDSDTISGSFNSFEDSEGGTVAGSLTVAGTIVQNAQNEAMIAGDVTGSLEFSGNRNFIATVDADITNGRFLGSSGNGLSGELNGTVNDGTETLTLTGGFVAER